MAAHSTGGYMRKFLFGLCAMTLVMSSAQAAAETLNNQMVIDLTKAGLGDEAIVAKIEETASNFDLSTTQMIDLKAKGSSGAVIAALIRSQIGPASRWGRVWPFVSSSVVAASLKKK